MWQTLKYVLFGIAWGCTWLVMAGIILFLSDQAAFASMMSDYPQQALGAAAVGVASTLPARLYTIRKLPFSLCLMLHGVIALSVYFPVSFALHWIPYHPAQWGTTALEILLGVGIFLGIWSVFFLINRSEARRINARVQELKQGGKEPRDEN